MRVWQYSSSKKSTPRSTNQGSVTQGSGGHVWQNCISSSRKSKSWSDNYFLIPWFVPIVFSRAMMDVFWSGDMKGDLELPWM